MIDRKIAVYVRFGSQAARFTLPDENDAYNGYLNQGNIKTALYCRTASVNPNDSMAIEAQLSKLRMFAEKQGFTKFAEYCDNGYNGLTLDRPAFVQLDADISAEKIDTIIVRSLDRVARNYMLADKWISNLKKRNVKIIAMDGSHDFPKIDLGSLKMKLNC